MMKLKQLYRDFWGAIAIGCTGLIASLLILTVLPITTLAAGNQSNQGMSQSANLIAPEPDFKINVYPKPSPNQRRIGYGLGGDGVTVLEQVGSNEGYTWNYVKFEKSPNLAGWVRGDFISLQNPNSRIPNSRLTDANQDMKAKQEDSYSSNQQSTPQNRYQTQQQGNYYQKQSSLQDNVKRTVLDFFKKS